jgi:hypothetical protein
MNAAIFGAMVATEVRMRSRRWSTIVTLLVLIALTWQMVPDPATGMTMVAIEDARVVYNSQCLALGSSLLGSLMLSLAGFYLVRGRMQEDLRYGASAILAATPVSNSTFVLGRWLGAVAYLCAMAAVFLMTMLVLHAVRGEGPIQLGVYLQDFALVLLPMCFFTASMALLCESWAPLMGKAGDVLYFILWAMQIGFSAGISESPEVVWSLPMLFDFSGTGSAMLAFEHIVHTTHLSIGVADFNKSLPPFVIQSGFWSVTMMVNRVVCALFALLPLLPAILLFHRFSPDRVKISANNKRRSLLGFVNRLLRPLSGLARPLFSLAARFPNLTGQVVADLALTLTSNPIAILIGAAAVAIGSFAPHAVLGGALVAAVASWGLLICDVSVRDFQAGTESMSGTITGGHTQRYIRQLLATLLLGLLFTAPIALRWLDGEPVRAAALLTGLFALSAAASLLGRSTRTARTFLALFLFGIYLSTQVMAPALDVVGANGVATGTSVINQMVAGILLCLAGFGYNRWRAAA